MKIKKSISGLYWDVIYGGRFIERFDTRKQAKQFIKQAVLALR